MEVMNAKKWKSVYKITAYDRDGSVAWTDSRTLNSYETEQISLSKHAHNKEGLVVVEPDHTLDDEFPSVLLIRPLGYDKARSLKIVPFTRVPYTE